MVVSLKWLQHFSWWWYTKFES